MTAHINPTIVQALIALITTVAVVMIIIDLPTNTTVIVIADNTDLLVVDVLHLITEEEMTTLMVDTMATVATEDATVDNNALSINASANLLTDTQEVSHMILMALTEEFMLLVKKLNCKEERINRNLTLVSMTVAISMIHTIHTLIKIKVMMMVTIVVNLVALLHPISLCKMDLHSVILETVQELLISSNKLTIIASTQNPNIMILFLSAKLKMNLKNPTQMLVSSTGMVGVHSEEHRMIDDDVCISLISCDFN